MCRGGNEFIQRISRYTHTHTHTHRREGKMIRKKERNSLRRKGESVPKIRVNDSTGYIVPYRVYVEVFLYLCCWFVSTALYCLCFSAFVLLCAIHPACVDTLGRLFSDASNTLCKTRWRDHATERPKQVPVCELASFRKRDTYSPAQLLSVGTRDGWPAFNFRLPRHKRHTDNVAQSDPAMAHPH